MSFTSTPTPYSLGVQYNVCLCDVLNSDLKLENVLLDHNGHCRISDLGLAVISKVPIKGYAGTPGYIAPESIKGKMYGPSVDIFSFGVILYRMLAGSKPFRGKGERELDRAVVEKKVTFPKEIFSPAAVSLLSGVCITRHDILSFMCLMPMKWCCNNGNSYWQRIH
jgi:serine/threonine protein kinase